MKRASWLWSGFAVALLFGPVVGHAQQTKPKAVRIAIVTFFSGAGALVGGPTVDSAKIMFERINKAGGIDGVPIEAQYVDESGGATKQVAEFRALAGHVDAVIGYASSGDALAIKPIAEQLHVLTIFSDVDSAALYEGTPGQWVFNTMPPDFSNSVARALYVAKLHPGLKSLAGINPDYAFGHSDWKEFTLAMQRLEPGIKIGTALFPALFSGQYTSELARLQGESPDLISTSTWGGDVVALVQQAVAQGSFGHSLFVFSAGTEGGIEVMKAVPAGQIFGSENGYLMHPGEIQNPEIAAFVKEYHERAHTYPVEPYPFTIQRPILALVAGYKAAIKTNDGKWPSMNEVAHALVGLHVKTMLGSFYIRPGDQFAMVSESVGTTVHVPGYPMAVFNKIITFPPSMIVPPVGENWEEWIGKLTPAILAEVPAPSEYKP